jgi:hypothetical protein
MITEAILGLFIGLFSLVLSLLPTRPAPGWLDDGAGYLSSIWTAGAGLGAWIPWTLVGTVFSAILACVVIGFTIKIVRIVASFFTAGGGSAA